MEKAHEDVLAGSVIVTSDQTIWYGCGDWQLKGIRDAIPGIPAYLPKCRFPPEFSPKKKIQVRGKSYIKVFGHYGIPLNTHREVLYPNMGDIIYPMSYGRMAFVRKSHILRIDDPKQYRLKMLTELEGAREIFQSLAEALKISLEAIGISGSVLAIQSPSWRHEIDFTVHGSEACQQVFHSIHANRTTGLFSREQLEPYHMPFKYKGKWFDPHFSDPMREGILQGAQITPLDVVEDVILEIAEDFDGIYYPAVYHVKGGKRLITFRTSQRGLFRTGHKVHFSKISIAEIEFPTKVEEVYLVMDDGWGEILEG